MQITLAKHESLSDSFFLSFARCFFLCHKSKKKMKLHSKGREKLNNAKANTKREVNLTRILGVLSWSLKFTAKRCSISPSKM